MALIESIIARAKANKQRIVLPESLEERTLTAADKSLVRHGLDYLTEKCIDIIDKIATGEIDYDF